MAENKRSGQECPRPKVVVPRARLELARLSTLDPKSSASANFATSAMPEPHTVPDGRRISSELPRFQFDQAAAIAGGSNAYL